MKFKLSFLVAMTMLISFISHAQLVSYPKPKDKAFPLSSTFSTEIKQGAGAFSAATCFEYENPEKDMVTKKENLVMFAFDPQGGAATVRITWTGGNLNVNNIEVVNKTLGTKISHAFINNKLEVTLSEPKIQVLIRFKNDFSNQLLLMADPMSYTVAPTEGNVKIFNYDNSPHVQSEQYDRYTIPNDVDVVYIEPGAVLRGTIHTLKGRTKPVRVTGGGIVLGNGEMIHDSKGIPWNAMELIHGSNHTLEGITMISSRHFNVRASAKVHIDNIKMFGYNPNIDGVVAGEGSIIENIYSKVNDDHIKLYKSNMIVRNCRFYEQTNGGMFQLAWNSITPGSNCLVENCEILAWEAGCNDPSTGRGGFARTLINLRNTDSHPISSNNVFRNIYVQGNIERLIGINGKYFKSASLNLENITLENVTVVNKPTEESWIYTGEAPYKVSFNFKNVTIGGKCMSEQNYKFRTEGNVELNYLGCDSKDEIKPAKP